LAEVGCRLRGNRSGSTGGAVNVRSTTLERQQWGESSDRFGSVSVGAPSKRPLMQLSGSFIGQWFRATAADGSRARGV